MVDELMSRRGWLLEAGGLAAGMCVSWWGFRRVERAMAAESSPRKKSVWPLAMREVMLRHLKPTNIWSAAQQMGLEGMEVSITEKLELPHLVHPAGPYTAAEIAGLNRLRKDMERAGVRITAFCMYNRFAERPDEEAEWCGRVARVAKALGVSAIRIDVVAHKMSKEDFLPLAIKALRKAMAEVEPTGVPLAIENHGALTNDPEFLDALFRGVGSPLLGLTLDTGNFYWYGHPLSKLYEIFERFASRVFHTHLKGINYPAEKRETQRPMGWEYGKYQCPIYQADVDFHRVATILDQAGYQGDLCIENEGLGGKPPAEVEAILKKELALLAELRGKLGRAPA
jgi:sugar phosphate isomerase/epimerase